MTGVSETGLRAIVRGTVNSLERRLVGALVLIAISIATLQVCSQYSARDVRERSLAVQEAAGEMQHAQQLGELVGEFRIASNLSLSNLTDRDRGSLLTDIAIQIGEQLTALRLSGMPLYSIGPDISAFDDLDRQVDAIMNVRNDRASLDRVIDRNVAMADLASAIAMTAAERRDAAQGRLDRAVADWQLTVTAAGAVTVVLVILILFDLLANILPALRRMHGMLRRLADGDLDFEVEKFRLRELQDLSGPLESFRRNAQAVQNLAFTDPSTGMPNRRAFIERIGTRLAEAAEHGGPRHLVMVVDVDRFKHVNDDFGHAAGDRVVKLIGERMKASLAAGAMVSRLGGDEFALYVPLDADSDGAAIAAGLVAAIRTPFDLGTYSIAVTISVGTAEAASGDAIGIEDLLHRADLALYAAKNGGRNRALGFAAELEEDRELDRALERDLARALIGGQLRMVYQPIQAIGDADREVEALIRWEHPELGDISPARFIPAAERSGLMVQLGNWIIDRSLNDLTAWPGIALSINLSPLQLQQDGFVPFLLDRCRHHAISPRRVILEVTESLSIENNSRALLTLELLRNAGFRIALDDFGTGYSSLSMMKTFKFDRLKIDRSLIDDLANDDAAQAVFDAAVTMALRIGAQVVAEGISDERLVAPVLAAGCTHLQGFYCSRPIEADKVADHFEIAPEAENGSIAA